MIGVVVSSSKAALVHEFFELFKTPWEFYREDRRYEVVLCGRSDAPPNRCAKLTVIYNAHPTEQVAVGSLTMGRGNILTYQGRRLPIYGECVTFEKCGTDVLVHEASRRTAITLQRKGEALFAQVGYDLFHEVCVLLTEGQPAGNAELATMELHIALLRNLILSAGICLVEIPPVPNGYRFIACLTHDVDHPSIRAHILDRTMFGFLHRALLGSVFNLFRGRVSVRGLIRNWAAALKLPFVYLGLARDIWDNFDKYIEIERGLGSSFFIIPFRNNRGGRAKGDAPRQRASRYGAADISVRIRELMAAGCEIGLHGIDAWLDARKGHAELQELRQITESHQIGARMHWLYFDTRSPAVLEEVGIDYDATSGYNETIGYRAGTTQVYKPLEVVHLLELPLHVMDTALFFPRHLDLSAEQARKRVDQIIDNAIEFGGCVTVNWHDRSIAPERLWGDFYVDLVEELRNKRAWFATAAQAVSWFRMRRSAVFETVDTEGGTLRVTLAVDVTPDLPDLQVAVYNERGKVQYFPVGAAIADRDVKTRFECTIEARL